jgi:hypothetical protein
METRLSDFLGSPDEILGIGQPIPTFHNPSEVLQDELDGFVLTGKTYLQSQYPELFARLGLVGVSDVFRVPSETNQTINALEFGDQLYVYAGNSGSMGTSSDGLSWTPIFNTTNLNITSLIYDGNQTWVRGLSNGNIQSIESSFLTTGVTWQARVSNLSNNITSLIYNSQAPVFFVAADSTGQISSTTIIATAFSRNTIDDTRSSVFQIIYGAGIYLKSYNRSVNFMETSTDLKTWNTITFDSTNGVGRIAYNSSAEKFVSFSFAGNGGYRTSTDGITWGDFKRFEPTNINIGTVTAVNGNFIATKVSASGIGMYLSQDGDNWQSLGLITSFSSGANQPIAINQSQGLYVAAQIDGLIKTSTDFFKWNIEYYPPNTSGAHLHLAFVNNLYFSSYTGAALGLAVSSDAKSWETRSIPNVVRSLIHGAGIYCAASNSGNVITSTDAVTWTASTVGYTTQQQNKVIFEQNQFVIVGGGGTIGTSTNGTSWTSRTSGITTTIFDITFGNNIYVYVATSGVIRSSTNAITWTARTSGTTSIIVSIAYGNNIFLFGGLGGVTGTSTDGVTWVTRTSGITNITGTDVAAITYDPLLSQFLLTRTNTAIVRTTTDGITWGLYNTESGNLSIDIGTPQETKITYGNNKYLLTTRTAFGDHVLRSSDLFNWSPTLRMSTSTHLGQDSALIFANNNFIAGGVAGGYYRSVNGKHWSRKTLSEFGNPRIYGLFEHQGTYYALVAGGILESTDLDTWTRVISTPTIDFKGALLVDSEIIAYGDMVTARKSLTSNTWELIPELRTKINKIILVSGLYVAACNGGIIRTTTQPNSSWSVINRWVTETSSDITSIIHGNDLFIISVNNGTSNCVATSTDLNQWSYRDFGEIANITSLIHDGDNFIASSNQGIRTSTDGITWTKKISETNNFSSALFADGKYIFSGEQGEIEITTNFDNKYTVGYDTETEFYVPKIEEVATTATTDMFFNQAEVIYYVRAK